MKLKARKTTVSLILMLFLAVFALIGVSLLVFTPTENAQAAADTTETSDLTFLLNEDGQSYKVRILDKTQTDIIIPSSYNGLPVTAIDDSGFTGCTALETIVIPSSVNYIGNNAFIYIGSHRRFRYNCNLSIVCLHNYLRKCEKRV